MPITVTCPGCSAKMRAADASAGKKIKCPKCQGVIAVPAAHADFEVVEDEPAAPKKPAFGSGAAKSPLGSSAAKPPVTVAAELVEDEKPQKRAKTDVEIDEDEEDAPPAKKRAKAVVEDDEDEKPRKKKPKTEDEEDETRGEEKPRKKKVAAADDEDDEDEKPRKKKRSEEDEDEDQDEKPRKKKKKRAEAEGGSSLTRTIVSGVVLLILLGVVGFVYWEKFGKKDKEETGSNTNNNPPSGAPGRPGFPPGGFPGPKGPGGPGPNLADNDLKRFQGEWKVVSAVRNGQNEMRNGLKMGNWRFAGDKLTRLDNPKDEGTIAIDSAKSPSTLDATDTAGEIVRCIYKFTGEDKLTICIGKDGKRPNAFDASMGTNATMFELERVKSR